MSKSPKKYSFREAAISILKKSAKPMTAREITEVAMQEGLIDTEGETPEATMAAQIYVDIKNNKSSVLRKVGRGLFSTTSDKESPDSPEVIIYTQNELVKTELRNQLFTMDPYQFEYLVSDLLQKIGYENVVVTKRSGDKGIDITANLTVGGVTNVKTVIQAKRYGAANKVDGKTVAQLRGSAEVDQRGLVITTSSYQKSAIEEARAANKTPISLVDGDKLIDLMIKYGIGIQKNELVILSVDTSYFKNDIPLIEISADGSKSRSIWPLPGGIYSYVATLDELLGVIDNGTTDRKELVSWMISTFDNVKSEQTTRGYLNVPRNMGLITFSDGKAKITEDGRRYLDTKSLTLLYDIISKNIFVFDEIYEFIKTAKKSLSSEQILEYLKENFDVEWETYAQVNFRLLWLENLKKIRRTATGEYEVLKQS